MNVNYNYGLPYEVVETLKKYKKSLYAHIMWQCKERLTRFDNIHEIQQCISLGYDAWIQQIKTEMEPLNPDMVERSMAAIQTGRTRPIEEVIDAIQC